MRRPDRHAVALAFLALWFLPELLWPDAWLYRVALPNDVMHPISSVLKIALQCLAAAGAYGCARHFVAGDRTRRAWRGLGHGLAVMAAGQIVLAWWHVGQRGPAPFPSPADALFVPATLILAGALADFSAAHVSADLGVGSKAQWWRTAGIVAAVSAAAIAAPVSAVLGADAPTAERWVAAAYPVLDIALLAPAVVVLQQIDQMRGGALWRGWFMLVLGVLALAAGDIAFLFFSVFELHRLEPLLDFAFAAGYLLVAWGTRVHRTALE